MVEGRVYDETKRALEAASHLTDADAGSVAVLLGLAAKIDGLREREDGPLDNVSEPTYLKFADALGLTSASRRRLELEDEPGESTLGKLRAIRGGSAA